MSSHPDADAFVRAILGNPEDVTARLVFADWLEETGAPSNVAWAQFIRLMAKSAVCALGSPESWDLKQQADEVGTAIDYTLRVPAAHYHAHRWSFSNCLPMSRITLLVGDWDVPLDALDHLPLQVAEAHHVLPVGLRGNTVTLLASEPLAEHRRSEIERLGSFLHMGFQYEWIVVPERHAEIAAAVPLAYGTSSPWDGPVSLLDRSLDEHIVEPKYGPRFTPDAPDSMPAKLLGLVLATALNHGAGRVRIEEVTGVPGLVLRFAGPSGWADQEWWPARLLGVLASRVRWLCGLPADVPDLRPFAGGFQWCTGTTARWVRATGGETPPIKTLDLDISECVGADFVAATCVSRA